METILLAIGVGILGVGLIQAQFRIDKLQDRVRKLEDK